MHTRRYAPAVLLLLGLLAACETEGPLGSTPPRDDTSAAPADPSSFAATATSPSSITLAWSAVAGATGYILERRAGEGAFGPLATTTAAETQYLDGGLSGGTAYGYRIRAVNNAGSSSGREASATTPQSPQNPPPQNPGTGREANIAKGRVVDASGRPLSDVQIVVDNTIYFNTAVTGRTDANGSYRLQVPGGSWRVYAKLTHTYNGRTYSFELDPDDPDSFAGIDGAVRNFTWRLTGPARDYMGLAFYGGEVICFDDPNADVGDRENIELTFTPVGPLVDGSQGEVITRKLGQPRTPAYSKVLDMPIGRYVVTARYVPTDGPARPLTVRLEGTGEYAAALTADFEPEMMSCKNCLRLEVNNP